MDVWLVLWMTRVICRAFVPLAGSVYSREFLIPPPLVLTGEKQDTQKSNDYMIFIYD